MKQIHIYGFGKWIDHVWNLEEENYSLFIGRNESGKSTLMAFVEAIFFGFPSKRENQFIPRGTKQYGGSITLVKSPSETYFIERVASSRQRGKVTVHFSDGRSGDERDLENLLNGMDATTFKGIYHFGLDGLQGMKDLSPEKLNRYLYDAGMAGGTKLTLLEKQLEQEKDRLFKPRGKKTELNLLAQQTHEKRQAIKEWEDRLDHYEIVRQTVDDGEARLKQLTEEEADLQRQLRWMDKRSSLSPIIREWHILNEAVSQSSKVPFPQDGIRRLDLLQERKQDKEARLQYEMDRLVVIGREKSEMSENLLSENQYQKIAGILEQAPMYGKLTEEVKQIDKEITDHLTEQEEMEKDWGFLGQGIFRDAHIPVYIFEKYEGFKQRWYLLRTKEERLSEQAERQKREAQFVEEQLEQEKSQQLTKEEEGDLHRKLEKGRNIPLLQKEKLLKLEQIKSIEAEMNYQAATEKTKRLSAIGGLILSLLAAMYSFFRLEPTVFFGFIFVSLCIFIYIFMIKRRRNINLKQFQSPLKNLNGEVESINEIEKGHSDINQEHVNQLLEQHRVRNQQITLIEQKKKLLDQQQNQTEHELESLKEQWEILMEGVVLWCREASLPKGKDILYYERFLVAIREWKDLDKQRRLKEKKRDDLRSSAQKFEDDVDNIVEVENLSVNGSIQEQLKQLKSFVTNDKKTREERQRIEERERAHVEARLQTEQELEEVQKQLQALFRLANVEREEAFREKGTLYEKQENLKDQLQSCWHQIMTMIPDEIVRNQMIDEIINGEEEEESHKEKWGLAIRELDEEKSNLHYQIANAQTELSQLEEKGTYDEQIQQFSSLKVQLNEYAKQWAVFQASLLMIQKVKQIFEKERQPKVIQRAQSIFSQLTSARYPFLFAPLGEEKFLVEREDGQRFEAINLSRGTCELLYLSIRLGLAIEDSSRASFPLFLDETFVNMDVKRRMNVLKVLEELTNRRQIILFTCHEHIMEEMKESCLDFSIHTLD